MTFAELKNLVLYWVDDLAGDYFTDTQVGVFLNNAQKEIQKTLLKAHENYYTKRVQTTTVINQSDYLLPTDFMKVHRVEVVLSGTAPNEDKRKLDQITMSEADLLQDKTSTPSAFYLHRDRMVLVPVPDAEKTLRITYTPYVADMVNTTDLPDVPVQYHEAVAIWAAVDCFIKDDRTPTNLLAKKAFYEDLMKKDSEMRSETQSRSIVVTESTGYEVF